MSARLRKAAGRVAGSKFARNAAALQAGAGLNAAGNLASTVALAHILGARLQGQFIVAQALYSLLFFFVNLGLVQAAVTHIAAAHQEGDSEKSLDWLAFLLKAQWLTSLVLFGVGFLALESLAAFFGAEAGEAQWALILCATPLLEGPRIVVGAAFQGSRRMGSLAQTENGQEMVRVFLVVSGAMLTQSPLGPVLGLALSSAFGSVVGLDLYGRMRRTHGADLPSFGQIFRRSLRVPIRLGLRLGLKIGILRNTNSLVLKILPVLIIKYFARSEAVTYFRIAQSIMNLPLMLMQGISRTALPVMSQKAAGSDLRVFRSTWTKITLVSGGLIAAGIVCSLALIPVAVKMVFPPDYVDPVTLQAWILSIGFVIFSFAVAVDSFYITANKLGVAIRINLLGLFVCPLASIFLATQLPETGVAWGVSLGMSWVLIHFIYIARTFRVMGVSAGLMPADQPKAVNS